MPPVIDREKCNGCATCTGVCPTNAIDIVNGKAVVAREADCIECRACEAACENNAISFP